METIIKTNRRDFLKIASAASGGLLLGFYWNEAGASVVESVSEGALTEGGVTFNSYLTISPDNIVTIFSPNPELGQNIKTTFPMIVADELDADWSKVKVVQAGLDTKKFERQVTGGSGAIPHSWERLRKAGATARHLLVEAAAKRWDVSSSTLITDNSFVIDKAGNRKLSYGELASEASTIAVPKDVKLKESKDFKLIGKAVRNVDNK